MKRYQFVGALLTFLVISACTRPPIPTEATSASSTPSPPTASPFVPQTSATGGETQIPPTFTPSPSPSFTVTPDTPPTRTQYTLSVQMDYAVHHLAVSQTVIYVNQTGETLEELLFVVEPNRTYGIFRLNRLAWENGDLIEEYVLEDATLTLPLPAPLPPGENVGVLMDFELYLPPWAGVFGFTQRQANLGNWYPMLPYYDPQKGWMAHEPAVFGEYHVYEAADFAVDITLLEAGSENEASRLTLAASGLAEVAGDTYRYFTQGARNFTWSVSPEYEVLSEMAGDITILSYTFPEHREAAQATLDAAVEAVALFGELFGPYPYQNLTIVEVDWSLSMEFSGLFFLSRERYQSYDGTDENYLITLAVHEISHAWWYGLVGSDQALEPWLDEALATYSELLFYEYTRPESVGWWWWFRIDRYTARGWVNSTVYDHEDPMDYIRAVYFQGAKFLDQLRGLVGDEVFFAFLQDYAVQNAYGQASAGDFFALLDTHTEANFWRLWGEYFEP